MLATYLHMYTLMLLIVSLLFMERFKEGSITSFNTLFVYRIWSQQSRSLMRYTMIISNIEHWSIGYNLCYVYVYKVSVINVLLSTSILPHQFSTQSRFIPFKQKPPHALSITCLYCNSNISFIFPLNILKCSYYFTCIISTYNTLVLSHGRA